MAVRSNLALPEFPHNSRAPPGQIGRNPVLHLDHIHWNILLGPRDDNALIPLVMAFTSAWMEAALLDPAGERRWAQRGARPSDGAPVAAVTGVGLANVLAVHQASRPHCCRRRRHGDRARANALLALTAKRVIYRQPADQLATTASVVGLNTTEARAAHHTPTRTSPVAGRH